MPEAILPFTNPRLASAAGMKMLNWLGPVAVVADGFGFVWLFLGNPLIKAV